MRLLGIDYGTKRVGVALSDESGSIASPLSVLTNDEKLPGMLASLVREHAVEHIVFGESKDNSGVDNPIMKAIRTLASRITEETSIPVSFEPEFFTSAEARRGPGKELKPLRHGEAVDAQAAALILNSFISRTQA